jgi:2',3'-cyclic-nucleotide 2'-phosphodiesterase (5'-nucleotidase family)
MLRRTLLLCLLGLALLAGAAADPAPIRIRIVHTNDLHGHVERAAAVAAVAAEERERSPRVLLLDAGDCISGTPVSTVFQGRPIFEIMSAMGYDAVAVGNHEYDHGWERIAEFREIADFPLLSANARSPEGALLADAAHHVFDLGGVRVGVLGLITEQVPGLTVASASAGCTFEDPVEAARRLVPQLREKCDVVVLLTHLGVQEDAALAGAVPGIDLIVGGHSHTELKQALVVGDTRIVQAKCYGERVGVVELTFDPEERRVTDVASRLVEIDPDVMPSEERVRDLVATWEAKVDGLVSEVIGKTDVRLDKKRLRRHIERIYRELLGTDLGYQNSGGIRGVVEPGEIRIRDVWTVLPFDNTLVTLTLKGEQLPRYARGRIGSRFDPEAEYTIATNSYVADQQEKYFKTTDAPVVDSGLLMRDEVVKWVREHGGFEPRGPTGPEARPGPEEQPGPEEKPEKPEPR